MFYKAQDYTTKKTMASATVDVPASGAGSPEPSVVEVVPELSVEVTQQIAEVADRVRMPGESLFEVLGRVAVMTQEERLSAVMAASSVPKGAPGRRHDKAPRPVRGSSTRPARETTKKGGVFKFKPFRGAGKPEKDLTFPMAYEGDDVVEVVVGYNRGCVLRFQSAGARRGEVTADSVRAFFGWIRNTDVKYPRGLFDLKKQTNYFIHTRHLFLAEAR